MGFILVSLIGIHIAYPSHFYMDSRTLYLLLVVCVVALCFGVISGCQPAADDLMKGQTDTALFDQGKAYYDQGKYKTALQYFLYIKESFIRSSLAGATRYYAGECYWAEEKYSDAAVEYQSFLQFFPTDPLAPDAQYKLGVCYFEDARGPERDQTKLQKALKELEKVRANYPEHQATIQQADLFIEKTKDELARHEYVVAQFYRHEKRYEASNQRLDFLLTTYPMSALVGDALYLKGLNYRDLRQPENANAAFLKLITDFPTHPNAAEAHTYLDASGGLNK